MISFCAVQYRKRFVLLVALEIKHPVDPNTTCTCIVQYRLRYTVEKHYKEIPLRFQNTTVTASKIVIFSWFPRSELGLFKTRGVLNVSITKAKYANLNRLFRKAIPIFNV